MESADCITSSALLGRRNCTPGDEIKPQLQTSGLHKSTESSRRASDVPLRKEKDPSLRISLRQSPPSKLATSFSPLLFFFFFLSIFPPGNLTARSTAQSIILTARSTRLLYRTVDRSVSNPHRAVDLNTLPHSRPLSQ